MAAIEGRLRAAPRGAALLFIASAIAEYTIRARSLYDQHDASKLISCNEEIHRLTGHLRDLLDAGEEFTESRAGAVVAAVDALPTSSIDRLLQLLAPND